MHIESLLCRVLSDVPLAHDGGFEARFLKNFTQGFELRRE